MVTKKSIAESLTALIVFLFMYTALSKLMDHRIFVQQLGKSPLLGPVKSFVSIAIPAIEFALVALLTFPKTRLKGLWGTVVLLSCFTVYLTYMVIFTPDLPCTCGGVINQMSWTQHIFFNLGFVGIAAIAIRLTKQLNPGDLNNTDIAYS